MIQSKSRTGNAIRNLIFGIINKILMLFVPFFLFAVIRRNLGTEYLGLNNLFASLIQMLSLAEMGIGSALVYEMYRPVALNNTTEICALLQIYKKIYRALSFIIISLGVIILPFLRHFISGSYPREINIYVLFGLYLLNTSLSYGMFAYKKSIFQAYQRYDLISKIASITNILLYIGQFIILLGFKNYYLYVLMFPISTILDNILTYTIANKMYPEIKEEGIVSKERKLQIRKRMQALAGHKIGAVVINSLDSIVISSFLGLYSVALYSNYFYIVKALAGIVNIGYNSVLPSIGNSIVVENKEHNYILFKNLTFVFSWFVGVGAVGMFCLYQPFITMWMGKEFLMSTLTMSLFVIYFYTWQVRIVGLAFKDAAGLWKEDFWKPYVGLIINLMFNIILVMCIGINGVLLSTIIIMVCIYFPWETYVLFKHLFCRDSKEYLMQMLYAVIVTVITSFIMYIICKRILIDGFVGFLVKSLICVIGSNIIFCLFYMKKKEFHYICELIKNKISNSRVL